MDEDSSLSGDCEGTVFRLRAMAASKGETGRLKGFVLDRQLGGKVCVDGEAEQKLPGRMARGRNNRDAFRTATAEPDEAFSDQQRTGLMRAGRRQGTQVEVGGGSSGVGWPDVECRVVITRDGSYSSCSEPLEWDS